MTKKRDNWMNESRIDDSDRLTRLEADVSWIKEEVGGQGKICGKTADDVTEIKIMLAEDRGHKRAIGYAAHAASVVLGAVAGLFSGSFKQ